MKSLLIVGLPLSLTKLVFDLAREVLPLNPVEWVQDGQILLPRPQGIRFSGSSEFLSIESDPDEFQASIAYLERVVRSTGEIYRDAVQPFIIKEFLRERSDLQVIYIRRDIAEIANGMSQRDWPTPSGDYATDLTLAQKTLDTLEGVQTLEFDDLVHDERPLSRLFGKSVRYLTDDFIQKRDKVLAKRDSAGYIFFARQHHLLKKPASEHLPNAKTKFDIPKQSKKIVLLVSDAQCPTGFARVGKEILGALSSQFEVHQAGINYHGSPHGQPWPIYPAQTPTKPLETQITLLAEKLNPDVIVFLNDPWAIALLADHLKAAGIHGKMVGYCAVDGVPISTRSRKGLSNLDHLVTYTEFGRRAVFELFAGSNLSPPNTSVIAHGVDTETFFSLVPGDPEESRKLAKAQLFPPEKRFQESFVVLNANRNQPRKCIDLTIRAFADFARTKPDNVLLFLHMARSDLGWDVLELCEHFGISNRVVMSTDKDAMPSLTDRQMNLLYNACEIGVSTTAAEGWGLIQFEHAAAGGGQILPAIEPLPEIWDDAAMWVKPALAFIPPGQIAEWYMPDVGKLTDVFEQLYANPEKMVALGQMSQQHTKSSRFSWKSIGMQWANLISELAL